MDRQAAGCVTRAWLKKKGPTPLISLWTQHIRGRGDLWGLTQTTCPICYQSKPRKARGRKRLRCESCARVHKSERDAQHLGEKVSNAPDPVSVGCMLSRRLCATTRGDGVSTLLPVICSKHPSRSHA